MKLRGTMRINEHGHLEIGGCDTVDLAQRFGTPLYVLDEALVRQNCREYRQSFADRLPKSEIVYAGKALLTRAICKLVEQEGLGLDVVSGGELYTALNAGFPPERIVFHGNNKSPEEIKMALSAGVGRLVIDNYYEMELVDEYAGQLHKYAEIIIRVTPGVEAHTHSYIQTGQLDSKFGFPIEGGEAIRSVERALANENLVLRGFHCHIGSQIFELDSFVVAVRLMFDFLDKVRKSLGYIASELDLGGGLGIRYNRKDKPQSISSYAEAITGAIIQEAAALDYPVPKLIVEPGRSIVGEAGTTLYTVGSVKEIPGIRKYAAVDGGMADNPRVALYQAEYEALLAAKADREPEEVVSIAGKCCESGDMLIWDANLPRVRPGDLLAVFSTGAYNYSMASNYNRLPRPAMVTVYNGEAELIVKRESYADLVRNDVIPSRFSRSKVQSIYGVSG